MAKTKIITIVYVCLALILSCGMPVLAISTKAATVPLGGIVVPLYTYPTDSSWSALIHTKQTYPTVPIIAIINPNNGVGSSKDSNFVTGINNLKKAGIIVIGYVYTSYGSRSLASIEQEMSEYKTWYAVNGIFFDEMSNLGSTASYYSSLESYSKSQSYTMTMGNPGTTVSTKLVGIFANLCIYENPGMPSMSSINGFSSYGKGFSYIAYGVGSLPSQTTLQKTTTYVSYIYITNLGGSNPYNGLPSYVSKEASILAI
jgi:hypothetical protein